MRRDARKLAPAAQETIRRQAVAAVLGGMTQLEAARVFGVARNSVGLWVKAYRKEGEAALAARKRGPKGERGRLLGWQAGVIVNLITDRQPEQLKLPFALWTAEAVRQLIFRRFKVRVSARSVRRYLKRWGFTPQKPRRRAYEQNSEAVQQWLSVEYPAIRARAKREKARIYWGDQMGVRSDDQAGRSYAPKGKTPVVAGTGQRFGCNMMSAISNRGDLAFMLFKKRFTAPVCLQFLRRLVKHAQRKVFLILDGHPVHKSRRVQAWLEENAMRIELFLLPGYSPELNPDEMLNQDVKTNAVRRKRPRNRRDLIRNLRSYLYKRRDDPDLVKRYFHEESVRYAAA